MNGDDRVAAPDVQLDGDRVIAALGRQLGDAMVRIAQLEDVITTLVEREAAALRVDQRIEADS